MKISDFASTQIYNLMPEHRVTCGRERKYEFTQALQYEPLWYKISFEVEYSWFEFRVFLLLDLLPYQDKITRSVLLFNHSWKEKRGIRLFPKGISAMRNTNSIIEDFDLR